MFTQTMLKVWNNGKFTGSYPKSHKAIADWMPPWQSPIFIAWVRAMPDSRPNRLSASEKYLVAKLKKVKRVEQIGNLPHPFTERHQIVI